MLPGRRKQTKGHVELGLPAGVRPTGAAPAVAQMVVQVRAETGIANTLLRRLTTPISASENLMALAQAPPIRAAYAAATCPVCPCGQNCRINAVSCSTSPANLAIASHLRPAFTPQIQSLAAARGPLAQTIES